MIMPMFVLGIMYNTLQGIMPKIFEERMVLSLDGKIELIGTIIGIIYAVGAFTQLLGGYLADRISPKIIYVSLWFFQAPLIFLFAVSYELPLALIAGLLTIIGTSILPAENIMLSKFAPSNHQGLVFGIKYVVAFGAAPLGVYLTTISRETTGEFTYLLLGYSCIAVCAFVVTLFLPDSSKSSSLKLVTNQ